LTRVPRLATALAPVGVVRIVGVREK